MVVEAVLAWVSDSVVSCSIPALLAAIEFLIPSNPLVLGTMMYDISVCSYEPTSSACYELRADGARYAEAEYKRIVTDAVAACTVDE